MTLPNLPNNNNNSNGNSFPVSDDNAASLPDDAMHLSGTSHDHSEKIRTGEETVEITAVMRKVFENEGYEKEDYEAVDWENDSPEDYYEKEEDYGWTGRNSDAAELSMASDRKGIPKIFAALIVVIGLAVTGVGGFLIVEDYIQGTDAVEAPMPEDDELFDESSAASYDGPSRHEIDWDAEFDKIDYEDPDNLGGVVVPSLGMHSEIIKTGAEAGSLVLPDPPAGTWYESTAEMGSEHGNSILAGHVNHPDGNTFSEWAQMHRSERGMLIGVRDHDGNIHIYEATDMNVYHRQALPSEMFRTDGDHSLHLVTCSGEVESDNVEELEGRYFEHNLVVSGELVETLS